MGPIVTIGPKEYNYLSVISWSLTWGGLCRTDWNNKLALLHDNGFLPQEFLNIAKISNMIEPSWLNLNWTWNNRELKKWYCRACHHLVVIKCLVGTFPSDTRWPTRANIKPKPSNTKRRPDLVITIPLLSKPNGDNLWWGKILSSPHAKYKLAFQNREDIKSSIICKSIRIKDQPAPRITNPLQSSFYWTRVRSLSLTN